MSKRKSARKRTPEDRQPTNPQEIAERSAARGVPEEELQGPPAAETLTVRGDLERRAEEVERQARLTAGDVDADWERAGSVGEEAPGGSVATPDQDRVDEIGNALGVPRAPDEEFRTSAEILEGRDRYRAEEEEEGGA